MTIAGLWETVRPHWVSICRNVSLIGLAVWATGRIGWLNVDRLIPLPIILAMAAMAAGAAMASASLSEAGRRRLERMMSAVFLLIAVGAAGLAATQAFGTVSPNILTAVEMAQKWRFELTVLLALSGFVAVQANRPQSPEPFQRMPWALAAGILALLAIFTWSNLPDMGKTFSGTGFKNNAYIEPALTMTRQGDPFAYRQTYLADPIKNPTGNNTKFGHLPILEWTMAAGLTAFGEENVENVARTTMIVFLGLFLVAFLLLFRREYPPLTLLLAGFLVVHGSIFNQVVFTPVYDIPAIGLAFVGAILAQKYRERDDPRFLAGAGVSIGIGIITKLTAVLFGLPLIAMLLLLPRPDRPAAWSKRLGDATFLFASVIAVYLLNSIAVAFFHRHIPLGTTVSYAAIIAAAVLMARQAERLRTWFRKTTTAVLRNRKIMLATGATLVGLAAVTAFVLPEIRLTITTSVSGLNTMFNLSAYGHVLEESLKNFDPVMTVFLAVGAGQMAVSLFRPGMRRCMAVLFLLNAVLYFIFGLKSIFFHFHYWLPFLLIMALMTADGAVESLKAAGRGMGLRTATAATVSALVIMTYFGFVGRTDPYTYEGDPYVTEAARYLTEHTAPQDFYLSSGVHILSLYASRPTILVAYYDSPDMVTEVQKYGFAETMKKYGVKYYITRKNEPDYLNLTNLFRNNKIAGAYERQDIIAIRTGKIGNYFETDASKNLKAEEIEAGGYFILERNIGDYSFYRLASPTGNN